MKKIKLTFAAGALALLVCVSFTGCQTDDSELSPQETAEVTAADLFVASEAYCNLKKEIGKEMRKERNAISKLSKEELAQYNELKKEMLHIETRMEAIAQLKELTGYDYQTSRDRISALVREVFEGTNFTKLELMKARRKSRMHKASITRAEGNEELREICYKECEEDNKERVIDCYDEFEENIKDLPASEFPWGDDYLYYVELRDNCLYIAETLLSICEDDCDKSYPDEK